MTLLQRFKHKLFARRSAPAQTNSEPDLALASEHWAARARQQRDATLPSSWAESPLVINEHINPLVSGKPDRGWLEAVAVNYFPEPVNRCLSLGCGGGGLERHGLQLGICTHFDAFDVSAGAVDIAIEEATKVDLADKIDYQVANLNELVLPPDTYDAVFASQSVHHIEALEFYMQQVSNSLKEGGLFIVNEFVGPNQFQWTDKQLRLANDMLESIPEQYRYCIREEGFKQSIERPTIAAMNAYDPTEAICSQDILPLLNTHFDLVEQRDFGGTLLHLVLDNIAGNLEADEEGKAILRDLIRQERELLEQGEISSDFTLIVVRKKPAQSA